ncbi:hypothetical protein ES703_122635 [subsurface metagenome]
MGEDYSDVTNKDFEKCTELLYNSYTENNEAWKMRMISYLDNTKWIFKKGE